MLVDDKLRITVRLSMATHEKVSVIARRDKRSLNSEIEFLIQEYVADYEKKYGPIKIDDE